MIEVGRNTPTYVGTTAAAAVTIAAGQGTPPRMWGQLTESSPETLQLRNTPTYVGTTLQPPDKRRSPEGTPPRMWGQLLALSTPERSERNTPTYVGTTSRENLVSRGIRNTPTYVGTTAFAISKSCGVAEHPHVCGDNCSVLRSTTRWNRNTPTYVGTTTNTCPRQLVISEHPHVCGDNVANLLPDRLNPGTPPRMWGQLFQEAERAGEGRNTPTYVGTTTSCSRSHTADSEHPHVCGDNDCHFPPST